MNDFVPSAHRLNGVWNRRKCLALLAAGLAHPWMCWGPEVAGEPPGEEPAPQSSTSLVTPATQAAIDRGLAYLAGRQNEDGSLGGGGYSRNVAVCSLAGLAFMCAGNTPGRGRYGRVVDKHVDYVLAGAQDSGFIVAAGTSSHGPMYGHGFATLFLAQVFGMSPRPDVREKLSSATQLIVDSQNDEGGWRYHPRPGDADISVTICQVMALRAALNAGIYVPKATIDRCIEYVKSCQNPDGGFAYMSRGGDSAFARAAAGVAALYTAGVYEGDEIERGLRYLMQHLPNKTSLSESHFFYGHYYAAQAMWQAGGDYWHRWYPAIRDVLLDRQHQDGYWMDSICAEYGTAMACIVLQLPNDLLPIFQR